MPTVLPGCRAFCAIYRVSGPPLISVSFVDFYQPPCRVKTGRERNLFVWSGKRHVSHEFPYPLLSRGEGISCALTRSPNSVLRSPLSALGGETALFSNDDPKDRLISSCEKGAGVEVPSYWEPHTRRPRCKADRSMKIRRSDAGVRCLGFGIVRRRARSRRGQRLRRREAVVTEWSCGESVEKMGGIGLQITQV